MSDILTLAEKQRKTLSATDAGNLENVVAAYGNMYENLQGDIDALILAIEKLENPTSAQVKALPQYKRLMRRAEEELDRFTAYLETAIGTASAAALVLGLSDSAALINLADPNFSSLPGNAIKPLIEFLRADGPLYARLKLITDSTIDSVIQSIIDGVSSGFNPRKIASAIQDAFGGGLTDALRNMRTVQIKAYQEATRANYLASDGIVTGWVWFTNLAGDPCMSCISMHGTEHTLDETLDDHYNGECAMLPLIPEFGNPVEQAGQAWFDSQPQERQIDLMGKSKYEAYKAGNFEFSALSNLQDNDVYGQMRTETSLKDLVPSD